MKRNKNKNLFWIMIAVLVVILLYNNGTFGRLGLSDYAQEQGLLYDTFTSNTLTTSETTKQFTISPVLTCGGTRTEFTRILQNDKWKSTAVSRQGISVCTSCSCNTEVGSYLPAVSVGNGIMTISGNNIPYYESCSISCPTLTYIHPSPIYTKFDWAGKDTVIKVTASCNGQGVLSGSYGNLLVGNVPVPLSSTDNLLEVKWSKVNPRTFAIFRNGDIIQEDTVPETESTTTCPDFVCGQWSALQPTCDPTLGNDFDYALAPSYTYSSNTVTSTAFPSSTTIFQAASGEGIFIGYVNGNVGTRVYLSSGDKKCTLTGASATFYYTDGTSATTGIEYSPCESNYCGLDNYKGRSVRPYALANPYIGKLVNRVVLNGVSLEKTSYQGAVCPDVSSASLTGHAGIDNGPVVLNNCNCEYSATYPGLSSVPSLQQATCSGSYGTIYKNRICLLSGDLNPAPEDICHTTIQNVTTQIGLQLNDVGCPYNDPNHGMTYPSPTLNLKYIRYSLPFNCDLEDDEVKVYEVFNSGTDLVLESTKYQVVKFCREFKAEIYNEGAGLTIDSADEIYESLALGETLTIPDNQLWALHYIANVPNTCNSSEELDAETELCVPTVGFNERLQILNGQLEAQAAIINDLEANILEKAALIQSLNLTLADQIQMISLLNMTITDQAQLIKEFNFTIDNQIKIIHNLNLTVSQQAEYINQLNLSINDQAELINELTSNLNEKIELVSQLQITTANQAALIDAMNLEFADQAAIISALNLTIKDDARIISNLTSLTEQQGNIISLMNLTTAEQISLIEALQGNVSQQAEIIDAMGLNSQQQAAIILNLTDSVQQQAIIIANLKLNAEELQALIDAMYTNMSMKDALIEQLENTEPRQQKDWMPYLIIAIGVIVVLAISKMDKRAGRRKRK